MKIYSQKGLAFESEFYCESHDELYIYLDPPLSAEKYFYTGDLRKYDCDAELANISQTLIKVLFKDTDKYYQESKMMPVFIYGAGQDSQVSISKEQFKNAINNARNNTLPNFYRHLYLGDCEFLVGTIQNLLNGLDDAFINYFIRISDIGKNEKVGKPNIIKMEMSDEVSRIEATLENYFIKAHSILDIFTKLAYEFENINEDLTKYDKLKGKDILWGDRKKLKMNNIKGTLFNKNETINLIETLRNEVVHNGSWELNPTLYMKFENYSIVERYMLFPDIEKGHLSTIKNRRHFFGSQLKVNDILPKIHIDFLNRVYYTAL